MNNPQNFFSDFGSNECCIFDSNRGIYNVPNIIMLAMSYGYEDKDFNAGMSDNQILDSDASFDAVIDAEDYLSRLLPDGYWFGYTENGDVGIWKVEDEEDSILTPEQELMRQFNEEIHDTNSLEGNDLYTIDESELDDYLSWKAKRIK